MGKTEEEILESVFTPGRRTAVEETVLQPLKNNDQIRTVKTTEEISPIHDEILYEDEDEEDEMEISSPSHS
jgi:hypothetical protein